MKGTNIISTKRSFAHVAICMSLLFLVSSCITPRRVNYLQDLTQGSQIQIENKFEAAIAPYDELNIIVTTSSSKKS